MDERTDRTSLYHLANQKIEMARGILPVFLSLDATGFLQSIGLLDVRTHDPIAKVADFLDVGFFYGRSFHSVF
jgi:hypothetical protein